MYLECIVSLVMHIASGSALETCSSCLHISFAGHVLVFVLCEHFCLVSMCSHVYCFDPTHLVTSLLFQLPHLLSLITLLICSLFILLVFVVLSQFVVICSLVVSWPCPAFSCPACQIVSWVFPPWEKVIVCFGFGFISKISSSALLTPCLIPHSWQLWKC